MSDNKKPIGRLQQLKQAFSASRKMLGLVWRLERKLFLINLVAVIVPAVTPFINAYLLKLLIDLVVSVTSGAQLDYRLLITLISAVFILDYMQRFAFSVQSYVSQTFFIKLPIQLYQMILNKITSLDVQYFEDSNFRDTLQKVGESYDFRPLNLVYNLFFMFQTLAQISIALYAMIRLNVWIALLVLLSALPELLNQLYYSRASWGIWDSNTPYRKKFQYLAGLLQSGASIKELKIFQTAKRFLNEIKGLQQRFFSDNVKILKRQLYTNAGLNFFDSLLIIGVFIYVFLQALAKRLTVGDINFYTQVVGNFNLGVYGMFRNVSKVLEESLYVESIFDLMAVKTKINQRSTPVKVNFKTAPEIEFRDVSFHYPGTSAKVLDNFSLIIKPGEKIAFVGENGAGKTTLIKLLARFYDVDEGEILINGTNIKNINLENWYRSIGVLFQDFVKYEYPVKDNIFFGKVWEKENLGHIIDAAKSAGAHPMIQRFEHEYSQMLGRTFEGGIEPSGGQWQKIALARAFFRNAPILVLDEPTAAIDAKAESEIFSRVEKLSKDKTVIIISHRFSTVRNADKIYVIDKGKIIESGSHEHLIKLNGQYTTLFNLQAKGYR